MSDIIKKIIAYYAHNEVTPRTRDRVLKRLAKTQDDDDATEAYHELWNEIKAGEEADRRRSLTIARWWPKIAAVLVPVLIIIGLAELHIINSNKEAGNIALVQKHTIDGESKDIVLPDGTKVSMKGGTVIQYPSSFEGAERKVHLVGEAFFDIHHDSGKPFHVVTPFFDITDIGTSFNVSSYMTTDEVTVYVKTGIVELRPESSDSIYRLTQDESLSYNVKSGKVNIGKGLPQATPAWKTTQINLDNLTLAEAMDKLAKVYGVNITTSSKKHNGQRITVHFNRGESLEGVLKVICNIFPDLSYQINGNNVVLK